VYLCLCCCQVLAMCDPSMSTKATVEFNLFGGESAAAAGDEQVHSLVEQQHSWLRGRIHVQEVCSLAV
jgi:hypothetical protein